MIDEQEMKRQAAKASVEFFDWVERQENAEDILAMTELVSLVVEGVETGYVLTEKQLQAGREAASWLAGLAHVQGFRVMAWYFVVSAQEFQEVLCGR